MSSDIVYEAVIPIEPRSKKNNQKICYRGKTQRPFIKQSDKYIQFEKDCGFFLKHKPPAPIDYPVNVKCVFYRSTRIRCDLVNLEEAILDVLTRYEIIADDNFNIVATMDGSTVLVDKNNPRIEITITKENDL